MCWLTDWGLRCLGSSSNSLSWGHTRLGLNKKSPKLLANFAISNLSKNDPVSGLPPPVICSPKMGKKGRLRLDEPNRRNQRIGHGEENFTRAKSASELICTVCEPLSSISFAELSFSDKLPCGCTWVLARQGLSLPIVVPQKISRILKTTAVVTTSSTKRKNHTGITLNPAPTHMIRILALSVSSCTRPAA